ncbi:helix-turn-helix domain-containing protein [Streptomyces atroolivaceus]|uniref:Helix-turn-helix domain-containing protein n=1 Tax=Streptomyces atroolivaceus TaxID=66869 RepID=A0ABV9V4T2_STRAZ|nr:helix-turn-helix transcriptional regulator [Streptomyces atroolivaceus]
MNRKELDPDVSASAAFGERLRRSRDGYGYTQDELARAMGYSGTHVSAVETNRKPPTLRFAERVDKVLGTGDTFGQLFRSMRNGALLEGFPEYVGFEGRASEIRLFEIGVIPGLLQTPAYASELADSAVKRGAITPEQAYERVKTIEQRQAAVSRPIAPIVLAVLDESCIRRPIGEPEAWDMQLARLIDFAELPNTVLQIAPYSMGARRTFNLPLYVLTMPDRSLMSYAESAQRGQLERESTSVLPMLTAYHQLQAESMPQAASVAMISQLRKGAP